MFKKHKLALGIAASLLGGVVVYTSVQAVHVNPDGTGQVLIFPYYNAHPGYITNVNLVNSTNQTKAVRIRFRDSAENSDVSNFNLYLSPQDVWTGSVRIAKNKSGVDVVSVNTRDRTCAMPALASCKTGECEVNIPFNSLDVKAADLEEGFIEVIEMGVVNDSTVVAGVKHVNGIPKDCTVIEKAWTDKRFTAGAGDKALGLTAPSGGLFGSSAILNIAGGGAIAIDPVAIENYSTVAQHYKPTDINTFLLPSLASGNVTTSNILVKNADGNTDLVETEWKATEDACLKAIAAPCGTNPYPMAHVLLGAHLMNEYFADPTGGYDGHTDWVITFPMRQYDIFNGSNDVLATIAGVYDREENQQTTARNAGFGFVANTTAKEQGLLARGVNVISFTSTDGSYDKTYTVLGSAATQELSVGAFVNGWANLSFPAYTLGAGISKVTAYGKSAGSYDASSVIYQGVPVLGFAAIQGKVGAGNAANFADAIPHRVGHLVPSK
ncbi:hypothetical protein [Thiolinea disciformis]|uniref:hypothetical protein n=1 Tax=Thiolinea disciformis TaxID=125614 RepID=UPI00036382AB|nr:hypothetical protein [Thiolinea disciformis]